MEARELYLDLLKKAVLDVLYSNPNAIDGEGRLLREASNEEVDNGRFWPERAHTMIGRKRLDNIQQIMKTCIEDDIPGDFIETGVWRGGATILMRAVLKAYGVTDRRVFVADSFEGLPPPDPRYPEDSQDIHHQIDSLKVSLEEVRESFRRYGLLDDQVVFIKGFFEHSLEKAPIGPLAVLRLDGDMYSSTIQVLEQLYDRVVYGGYIIIDDYGLQGARAATNKFRELQMIKSPLYQIDETGVFWRKE